MKQVRFTNGYTTYTDRIYSDHCRNEVYCIGHGWLGDSVIGYDPGNTPFNNMGNGFSETWDTHYCHNLIFQL